MGKLHKETPCPRCKAALDASTHPHDESITPEAGSISICAYCGLTMVFLEDLSLREATPKDLAGLSNEELNWVFEASLRISTQGRKPPCR